MDAQGALDSLLGRLTATLVNEAQLLGGICGDVEFIKDEMETMNGLLLHLTEAQHRDHQVRAWMKQVAGVTRDCEGNVELYILYVGGGPGGGNGVMRYLRRIPFFLRTVPIRRRIASRIRELKVRARDVGDRRLRYGVTVPDLAVGAANTYDDDGDAQSTRRAAGEEEEDRRRRSALLDGDEPRNDDEWVSQGIDSIIKWLSEEEPSSATAGHGQKIQPRFFPILGYTVAKRVAQEVYEHSTVARSFDCKAFVTSDYMSLRRFLINIIKQVTAAVLQPADQEGKPRNADDEQLVSKDDDEVQLVSKLQGLLKGKRTLCCTNVSTNDLSTIGNLCRLCSLKLQHKSYTENELVFKVKEFQSLNFLLVEGNNITNISFVTGAAPKLERIIWSFAIMDALSGINHLPNLTWLELNGNCSLDSVMREIHIHRNRPVLKHTPHPQRQKAATAVVASSSSAPSAPNYSPST